MPKVKVLLAQRRRLRRMALHRFLLKMIEIINFRHFRSFVFEKA